MKKIILTAISSILFTSVYAQDEKKEETPDQGWKRFGTSSILFNQAAFNNDFATGGVNSLSLDFNVSYDVNYAKGDWTWDNKFIGQYGIAKIDEGDTQKTNDRLELNSLVGKKATGLWSYSFFANFKTQFDSGFALGQQTATLPDGTQISVSSKGAKNSHFFSPAYLQFGPGMLWKKSDNLKVNIAPATSRLIFVADRFTEIEDAFGVDQGDTFRYELGASIQAYYKLTIAKNITMENILNLYSNYLEDPQNIDVDYTMNLAMKVNKYISANLTFQALYDDNTTSAWQIRETLGAGLSYNF